LSWISDGVLWSLQKGLEAIRKRKAIRPRFFLPYALRAAGVFPVGASRFAARMVEKKAPKRGRRPVGDRRQFLTMMSPSVIKAVKQAGLEDDRPAWDVMEEAAKQWLERRKGKRSE
jgi:hypothetical protein